MGAPRWVRTCRGRLCALLGAALVLAAGAGLLGAHAQQDSFSLPAIDPPGAAAKPAVRRAIALTNIQQVPRRRRHRGQVTRRSRKSHGNVPSC